MNHTDNWLRDRVGPAYDVLKVDPFRGKTPDQIRRGLAAERANRA